MKNLILKSDNLTDLSIDPTKTIFWIGAGIGVLSPCNLPLGNELTDTVIETALGEENKKKLIDVWNYKFPRIRDSIRNNSWKLPTQKHRDPKSGGAKVQDLGERPRLEFVIGEINKMDLEFQDVFFCKESNKATYRRDSVIRSLKSFSEAEPNAYHYALADFVNAGAMVVTTNFDICIEKALGIKADEIVVKDVNGVKAVEYTAGKYIYHVHGVATDEDIESNLGATLTNVSKSLSKQFTNELYRLFEENYTIIFIGYGGVDFFDIKPYFDGMRDAEFPGKAVYLHYCRDDECGVAVHKVKNYQYLLTPFQEQIICYGDTENFLGTLACQSGVKRAKHVISRGRGTAFDKIKASLAENVAACSRADREKYWFINIFRIASQLNVSMNFFYPDWAERLAVIYSDWKEDSPDKATLCKMILEPEEITRCIVDDIRNNNWHSEKQIYIEIVKDIEQLFAKRGKPVGKGGLKISTVELEKNLQEYVNQTCTILETESTDNAGLEVETAIIQYLCGPHTNNLCKAWVVDIFHRGHISEQLRVLLGYIDQLLVYPYNRFLYMTFYIGLSRRRHMINAILDKRPVKDSMDRWHSGLGDIYSPRSKCYGDIQLEWNICMKTPNLFDAGKVIEGILFQYVCRIFRGKWVSPLSVYRLYKIRQEIIALRED